VKEALQRFPHPDQIFSIVLWGLLGAFVGGGLTPLLGEIEMWRPWVAGFTVVGVVYGLRPSIRGRNGIPITGLLGATVGWLIGFVTGIWQLSSLGILAGAVWGAFLGERLQERFTRNTRRSETGRFWGN
jgi:hypothetical protein